MDCRTGEIHHMSVEQAEKFEQDNGRKLLPLPAELADELNGAPKFHRKNFMRNRTCICGSGIKFKRCCWSKYA